MEVVVCFNRNIVECKEVGEIICGTPALGFNRNIVECKEVSRVSHLRKINVLIETLWNVKFQPLPRPFRMRPF